MDELLTVLGKGLKKSEGCRCLRPTSECRLIRCCRKTKGCASEPWRSSALRRCRRHLRMMTRMSAIHRGADSGGDAVV